MKEFPHIAINGVSQLVTFDTKRKQMNPFSHQEKRKIQYLCSWTFNTFKSYYSEAHSASQLAIHKFVFFFFSLKANH